MSAKGSTDLGETNEVPAEPELISTNQEAIPVPLLGGTRMLALRWITPPLNVYAVQAKDERPGKK
jgi:hypothetical protein